MHDGSGAPPGISGNGGGAAHGSAPSSAAVLESALDALRQRAPRSGDGALSPSQLAAFLVPLLSDGSNGSEGPLLDRRHRRALVRAVAEHVGPEGVAQVLPQTLPNLRFSPMRSVADLFADLGPDGVPSVDVARAVLSRFGMSENAPPDEGTVSEILGGLLSATPDELEGGVATDFGCVVRAICSIAPRYLNWSRAVRLLDVPEGLTLAPGSNWSGFAAALLAAPRDAQQSPAVAGLWGAWAHRFRQLQILGGLVALPADVFSFLALPGRRIVSVDDVANASMTVKSLAAQVQNSSWNSLDLIESLTQIADTDEHDVRIAVTEILEKAVKASAELVLMALVQIPQPWTTVHAELASKLLSMFFAGHPSHQLVFLRIWQTNRGYMLNAFRNFYVENAMNITRLLDVAQDLKILDALLDARPFYFALDVAALASRREYLNLEKWLQDSMQAHGSVFVRACLEFLDAKAKDDLAKQDPQAEQNFMPLTVQTVAVFLRVLRAHGDNLSAEEIDYFKVVRNLCLQLHPRLMNLAPGAEAQEPGLHVVTFPQDIHEEADSWYRQMYEEEISISDVVSLLQRTKASDDPRDHQIFACMVHTLFDEYRWFDLYYPPRELAMTAVVFGSLIQHQLIDYIPLGIAIRYVLDALREPPESNMFKFGLQALLRFQDRLPEWPQLGQALLALPHVQQSHPDIARMVRAAMSGQAPSQQQANGGGDARELSAPEEEKVPFTALNVDPILDGEEQREPAEDTSDRILFLLNNLSPSNLDAKLVEARRLITPDLHHWFSSYLVLQRVSIEPNNHGLYTQFLDGLDTATLLRHVLHETFVKVKALLNSDKTVQSTTERTLLKNLGSWLGGLTLARNKPVRHRNIAFKELLIQGYDSNRLIVAIPFVCKVLEQSARSKVFVPPNPWLMAVLRLLVELYHYAELKLNLKFEIEVLCKSLSIDLKQVQATTILRNRPQELAAAAAAAQQAQLQQQQQAQQQQLQQQQAQHAAHQQAQQQAQHAAAQAAAQQQHQQQQLQQQQMQQQQFPQQHAHQQQLAQQASHGQMGQHQQQSGAGGLAHDLERLSMGAGSAGYGPGAAQRARAGPPQNGPPSSGAAPAHAYSDSLALMLQSLAHYVVISPQLTLFANNATLKRMVYVAIDRAIREIIAPVVERSVTIASISTRELVTKDFAMEGDEAKMRKGAHQMAQNLAGSLALVTCKEPLRISMVTHARTLFLQSGFTEQTLPEQALVVIMGDNLELACSVIERAAMEKALPEVDDGLASAFASRRDHRARGRGYYWDSQALTTSQYAATLPDLLRLKPDGLQPQQLRVYEDFGKIPRAALAGLLGGDGERGAAVVPPGITGADGYPAAAGGAPPLGLLESGSLSAQQSLEKFSQCLADLERLLQQAGPQASIATLSPEHDLRLVVRQVPMLAAASVSRDETALAFSQKVVQLLYKSETAIARDIFTILLERLCEVSIKVAKEVTAWLIYAEDERKFNVPVTVGLIRAGLINIVEQDMQLSKFIARDLRPSVVDFAARLALECLREPACATRGQLVHTIEALRRASRSGKATDAAAHFLAELEDGQLSQAKTDIGNSALREQLAYCFAEWVRLFQQSPNAEKSFIDFVTQLQQQGILKGEEISSMFFRVCAEVGVDSYIKQKAVGGSLATGIFSPIDAFSKLIVLMIKYHADPTGANNEQAKVHYLTKILSIVVLVLAQSHEELGPHFQQKPFFRLFSSLLHDLHLAESSLHLTYFQALLAISNTLNTLQPSFFPSFTFSWMSLMSHRLFMPKLLGAPELVGSTARQEGWSAFHRLFASLLRFLAPFLRTAELRDTSRSLYRGTLRILLVLLHDFPEFLCNYHHSLCDIIPPSCIQLRNLVLSAFPSRQNRLPDPFTPNLKIDRLPEISQAPVILSDYLSALEQPAPAPLFAGAQPSGGSGGSAAFKASLDAYLRDRAPASFLTSLKDAVVSPANAAREIDYARGESRYDVTFINALVLYVGMAAIQRDGLLNGNAQVDVGIDVFQQLLDDLDAEGRYLLLTAAANQLRYPNSHSAYFSYLLLYLYGEGHEGDASTKEQITRVLLERLIVNRPHPWALLLTTFELLRNRRYILPKAPAEIERLLSHMKAGLVSGATESGAPGGPTEGSASSPGSQHMLAGTFAADANAAHLQHELRNGA